MPPSVRIGHFTFEVRTGADVVDFFKGAEGEDAGDCDKQHLVLRVSAEQAEDNQRDTLLHEIVHAVIFERGLSEELTEKVEEKVALNVATGLLGVLRDNPDLIEYLTQ